MKTYQGIFGNIRNLRYGAPGNLEFDYLGNVITIREPQDVLLVNWPGAPEYLAQHFGFLLAQVPPKALDAPDPDGTTKGV